MRNTACPLYSECLDQAARANVPGFACDSCPRRHERAPINPHEARSCAVLLALLFLPELYFRYLADLKEAAAAAALDGEVEAELPAQWPEY